ncbi:hypothetical protein GALMADRAFT_254845 [Galerina marginata CBS 339.88]|uniref:Uncharacterized protein n=1 Tax=Galerina marginata (strain CBS 339.88) TaxID=685588 RepID=A0A067SHH2_GALM3|nr:hypothetical protein GALMADRAFT_254845 [Galerina marginata CBS 339.88]
MNRPIVVVLVLIIVALALYFFYLSPYCVKPDSIRVQPRPLDLEDAVFTQPYSPSQRVAFIRSPYEAFERYTDKDKSEIEPLNQHNTLPALPKFCASRYPVGSTRDVSTPPPPAYTSFPHASVPSPWDITYFQSLNTSSPSPLGGGRKKRSFFSIPRMWIRTPSPLVISKPIMHPEDPIPGPSIEHRCEHRYEHEDESEHLSTDTTFLRPCAASHSVSDTIRHFSSKCLPMPSRAYVHNRDSISSSKIGLAF